MQTRAFELIVRYAETDAQGVVHHANYLTWFEEGRSDFLRQQGLFYTDLEKAGFFVVVAKAEVNYQRPAFYEDRITIETTLERMRGKIMEFSYRAINQDGLIIALARTKHMVLDRHKRPTRLPEGFQEKIGV